VVYCLRLCVQGPQLATLSRAPQRDGVPSVVWKVEDDVMEVDVAPRDTGNGKERSSRHLTASLTITSLRYLSMRLSLRAALTTPRRRARRPGQRQCSTVQFPRPPARARLHRSLPGSSSSDSAAVAAAHR